MFYAMLCCAELCYVDDVVVHALGHLIYPMYAEKSQQLHNFVAAIYGLVEWSG